MSVQRVEYIDLAKGFAILALILSHTNPGESINTWIFGFHMPIFFIVGGILLAMKNGKKPLSFDSIPKLLKRRCHNLLLPYVIFCLALTLFYGIMSFLAGEGFAVENNLIRTFAFQGIDSLWFIPCYFWSELISTIILSLRREAVLPILYLALLPGIIIMSIDHSDVNSFLYYAMKVLVSLSFFITGILIAKYGVIQRINLWVAIVLLLVSSIITMWSGFSAIGSLQFPHQSLYYFTAALMSLSIMALFGKAKDESSTLSLLKLFGQYSIVVLCTNNLLIEMIRLLDYKLTGNFLLNHGLFGSLLFFILIAVFEYNLIRLSQGRFGLIFGKK